MYGIIEMKPTLMENIDGAAYKIAEPKYVDVSGKNIGSDNTLWSNQSSLVTMNNCKYSSGLDKFKPTAHSTLVFTSGNNNVKLYCSYHLGETMMEAIKKFCEDNGDKTVTIKGVLTYSSTDNDFEIIPVFGLNSFVVAA